MGCDTIGLDPIADETLTLHRKLLADDRMVIIENLTNLEQVGDGVVFFCALPLKQADADGAPIRAAVFWARLILQMGDITKKTACNFVRKSKGKRVTNTSGYGILSLWLIKNESQ